MIFCCVMSGNKVSFDNELLGEVTMLKVWNFTVAFFAFLLLIVYSFSLSVPWFSHWLYDYSKPMNAHWEIDKEEKKEDEKTKAEVKNSDAVQFEDHGVIDSGIKNFEFVGPELPVDQNQEKDSKEKSGEEPKKEDPPKKTAVFTYDNHWSGALERFYERFPLPIQPTWWMLLSIGLSAGAVFSLFMTRNSKYSDFLSIIFFILQILCYAVIVGASIWNAYHFNVRAVIKTNVIDTELADQILHSYSIGQVYMGFVFPLMLMIIVNVVVIGLAFFTSRGCRKLHEIYGKAIDIRLSGFDDSNILIRHDGSVELFTLDFGFRWLFFPIYFFHRKTVRSNATASGFIGIFISSLLGTAVQKFRESFLAEYALQYQDMGKKAIRRLLTGISIELQTKLGACVEQVRARKNNDTNIPTAHNILKEVTGRCVSQFRQEVIAGVKDAVDKHYGDDEGFSDKFQSEFLDRMKDFTRAENICVLPEGTKFFSSKGPYSFVVVEQPPQLRTLNFTNTFFQSTLKMGENEWLQSKSVHNKASSIQLSFPFVIFVVVVDNKNAYDLKVFYNDRPLRTLHDRIFRSNFPNVQENGSVCLSFSRGKGKDRSVAEKVNEIIAYFWDSHFSSDYVELNYNPSAKIDPRLKNIWAWEEESRKDPLFTLRVPWIKYEGSIHNMAQEYLLDRNSQIARDFGYLVKGIIAKKQSDAGKIVREFCMQILPTDFDKATARILSERMHADLLEITSMLVASIGSASEKVNARNYERFSCHIRDLAGEIIDGHTKKLIEDCSGKGEVPINIQEICARTFANGRI